MSVNFGIDEDEIFAIMESTITGLEETRDLMKQYTMQLRSSYEENSSGIGSHISSISSLLENLESETNEVDVNVKKLVLKLTRAMDVRKAIREEIGENR